MFWLENVHLYVYNSEYKRSEFFLTSNLKESKHFYLPTKKLYFLADKSFAPPLLVDMFVCYIVSFFWMAPFSNLSWTDLWLSAIYKTCMEGIRVLFVFVNSFTWYIYLLTWKYVYKKIYIYNIYIDLKGNITYMNICNLYPSICVCNIGGIFISIWNIKSTLKKNLKLPFLRRTLITAKTN